MNEENTPIIRIKIRDLRREKALTQEALAEALGISRQSINAMEAGRCLPSLPIALQIADFFAVPLNILFALADEEEPNPLPIISNKQEANMTTLTPWSPLREMRSMLDDLMDDSVWQPLPQITIPAVNVSQTADSIILEMRLPGFKKEDLSIEVGDDFVTIAAEMKEEKQEEGEDKLYFRREFAQQNFSRTVSLPAIVQTEKATAEMKNGVLHIKVPKIVEEKPKTARLEIK